MFFIKYFFFLNIFLKYDKYDYKLMKKLFHSSNEYSQNESTEDSYDSLSCGFGLIILKF